MQQAVDGKLFQGQPRRQKLKDSDKSELAVGSMSNGLDPRLPRPWPLARSVAS